MITIKLLKGNQPQTFVDKVKTKVGLVGMNEWICDMDGDFTMYHPLWNEEAWIRSQVIDERIVKFGIISRKDRNVTTELYAVYHSSFEKMLLEYFDTDIETIEISSMPEIGVDLL